MHGELSVVVFDIFQTSYTLLAEYMHTSVGRKYTCQVVCITPGPSNVMYGCIPSMCLISRQVVQSVNALRLVTHIQTVYRQCSQSELTQS